MLKKDISRLIDTKINPTQRFELLSRSLNENYAHRCPFMIDYHGDQKIIVKFSNNHRAYDFILPLLAISRFDGQATPLAKEIAEGAVTNMRDIWFNLSVNNSKIKFKDVEEQYRWAVIINAVMRACGHIYMHKLCYGHEDYSDYSKVDQYARAMLKQIKPFIKTNNKIIHRAYKVTCLELDITIAKYCADEKKYDLSEDYYLRAARNLSNAFSLHQVEYRPLAFMIHSGLAEIHVALNDFRAAEAQYDHAMRYVAHNIAFFNFEDIKMGKILNLYHVLAKKYTEENQWRDQKRTLKKAIECYTKLSETMLGGFDTINSRLKLNNLVCQATLNYGLFFNEMPGKLTNLCSTNKKEKSLIVKDLNTFKRLKSALLKTKSLDESASNEEKLTLVVKIKPETDVRSLLSKVINELYPPKPKKKSKQNKKTTAIKPTASVAEKEEIKDSQKDGLVFSHSIFSSYKNLYKRIPQKGKKSNTPKKHDNPIAVQQHRRAPEKCEWDDEMFGNINYPCEKNDLLVVLMRNAFNCGKANFAVLPKKLLLEKLSKTYGENEAECILKHMITTLTEAKQAGFWGRGVKACPNEPIVKGTPYKEKLKPSTGYDHNYRIYGRKIHNGQYTLHIFDAVDLKPKSSSSKLEVLTPPEQPFKVTDALNL